MFLLLAWYVVLWRPAVSGTARAQAAKVTAEGKQITLEGQLAGLRALQRSLPSEEAKLRHAEIEVPATASVAAVLDQINAIAVADGITWTNETQSLGGAAAVSQTTAATVAPAAQSTSSTTIASAASAPVAAAGDLILALTLDVGGNYAAMTKFIADLEHAPRLIVIDTLTYSPGVGHVVKVTMTARAFYNPTATPAIPKLSTGS